MWAARPRHDDGSARVLGIAAAGVVALVCAAAVVVPAASARDGAVAPSAVDDGAIAVPVSDSAALLGTSATATAVGSSVSGRPVPATMVRRARNVPEHPRDGGKGRRIVYDKALMYLWIVGSDGTVVRRYPVTGRWDRPTKGSYRIYSKSVDSMNTHSEVTFKYMVRFAWGSKDTEASIGFHTIPVYYANHVDRDGEKHAKGSRMTTRTQLGLPIATGGCIRQSDEDALFLYRWSRVGDKVVVLPSP